MPHRIGHNPRVSKVVRKKKPRQGKPTAGPRRVHKKAKKKKLKSQTKRY